MKKRFLSHSRKKDEKKCNGCFWILLYIMKPKITVNSNN